MLGTLVNCITIVVGSLIGILFSKKVTEELSDVICSAAGVVTLIIGLQMAFETGNIIYLALSLIIGGMIGTALDIDGMILSLGRFLEHRFGKARSASGTPIADGNAAASNSTSTSTSTFAYAFLNASVLFCVGAMAIVGSFKAGAEHNYTMLYTKSVLDGFMAIVFAAAMGIGTAFSALSILVYQGALTLCSVLIRPYVSDQMISELTGVGGALVMMIGINLLKLRQLKTANYLPSVILIAFLVLLDPFIQAIAVKFI